MTAVHIDIIHGDHFIREVEPPGVRADRLISPAVAARTVGQPQRVKLTSLLGRPADGNRTFGMLGGGLSFSTGRFGFCGQTDRKFGALDGFAGVIGARLSF